MIEKITIWFEKYQHAVDPKSESDNYQAEIDEFLKNNKIFAYATELMIPDGDRDGYTMVAKLEISKKRLKTIDQSALRDKCPCDLDEYNYL